MNTAIPLPFALKVIESNDSRIKSDKFVNTKQMEVDGLKRRNIWWAVRKPNVPCDANILGGHFVYTLSNYGSPTKMPKAQFVAQGYNDLDKANIAHDTFTIRPSSIRIILSLPSILGFRLFAHDVTQAYNESNESS